MYNRNRIVGLIESVCYHFDSNAFPSTTYINTYTHTHLDCLIRGHFKEQLVLVRKQLHIIKAVDHHV